MAKMIYRNDTGEIMGVHIFGLHAADLIHEASNAVATNQTVQACPLLACSQIISAYGYQCDWQSTAVAQLAAGNTMP